MERLKIFTGNANPPLAAEVCEKLRIPLGKANVGRFADGEIQAKIEENVRGIDCFILQPTCPPVNESLMELLILTDALKRASAHRITAVIPYYGYARQDRKSEPRVPISSKLVANLVTAAGTDRVLAMDLHVGQIQGFFDIPVDHLYAMPVFLDYLKTHKHYPNPVVVSPDAGGVERARAFAKRLGADLAIVDKRRPRPNEAAIMNVIGDVKGRNAIIFDDMCDTGGTLVKVAEAIRNHGAVSVVAVVSHGVLSADAHDKIEKSCLEEMIITNSIPLAKNHSKKIKVLTVAPLLAEAIRRIHQEESVSALFI